MNDNRKYATVMFVDVANSTSIFEDLDPETVHGIMDGCFQIILDEVHKYEGTVNQFRGDCVVAIFGAPIAHENHAQRACHAALGIMQEIAAYGREVEQHHAIPFKVRIGLNTGPVVVGSIGEDLLMDYAAEGDTSHLAFRMESHAKPGTILISSNTHDLVHKRFKTRSLGKISYKRKEDSVNVYKLIDQLVNFHKERGPGSGIGNPSNTRILEQREPYTPRHLSDEILSRRSAIEGERKFVTVMFIDVPDAASIFKNLDPETIHGIMDGCFQIILDEVHKYEGTVNQFRGDCVMAIFGAPIAHENHAQRACRAAIGIMKAMEGYARRIEKLHGAPFRVRIGLNTGLAVVGAIGNELRMDYTADGDTSNLAYRMESHAKPDTILISSNTYKQIGALFETRSLGEISVKGKKNPVNVYELLNEKIPRQRVGIERQIYSKMVGRETELSELERQIEKLTKGSGAVVNIIGEAGIGKSRLLSELKGRAVMTPVRLLEGRAISIGATLSFYPVVDLLKGWAGIGRDDDGQTALSKLEHAVQAINPEHSDEMVPFIATLMGMALPEHHARRVAGITGEALDNLIFKNFRELLIRVAVVGPLLIVLEDLHWADGSSIGLFESIFRLARQHPILFINPMRPGYAQTTDRLMAVLREEPEVSYHELTLAPLDAACSQTLIGNMLDIKGLPASLVGRIVERADGNPYFIEEVVRSLIDQGLLVAGEGGFEVTEQIHQAVIPETVADLLTARIDRLEEKSRELIKTAAVIGRSFFYRILKMVVESNLDIDQRLAYLIEIQIIFERQRLEELEYLFTHALAQEAAYASILLEKRKPLHLKVARAIETLFAGSLHEFYGILSYHYTRGEDFFKAEEYLLRSGEEALKSSASSEAVAFFQQALQLYRQRLGDRADPEKIAYMEKCIAVGYYNKGQLVESIPYLKKALEHHGIYESKNVLFAVARAAVCLSILILRLYLPVLKTNKIATEEDNEVIDLLFKKTSAYSISNKAMMIREGFLPFYLIYNFDLRTVRNGIGYFLGSSAFFSYSGISFLLGRRILKSVESLLTQDDSRGMVYYQVVKLLHAFFSGNLEKELPFDEALVIENLRIGEVLFTTYYYIHLIFQHIEKGDFTETADLIHGMSGVIEEYRCDYAKSNLFYVQARMLMKMGRISQALGAAEQSIAYAARVGDLLVLSQTYSIKARMHIGLQDIEAAEKSLQKAEDIGFEKMFPLYLSEVLLSRFVVELYRLQNMEPGKEATSVSKPQKKVWHSGKTAEKAIRKAVYNSVELYRYMGIFHWHFGRQAKAFKYWHKSIEKGESMGARPELARTCLEVGRRLSDSSCRRRELNGLDANAYMAKAKKLFGDMDLAWDMEKLRGFHINGD